VIHTVWLPGTVGAFVKGLAKTKITLILSSDAIS